jgi:Gpi18-like mannosyltransferase
MERRDPTFYPLCLALIVLAVGARWLALPFQTHDMQDFLLPWFDYIVTHGRFAALSDNFYNYTPPYIYMMTAASYLDGVIGRVALIKAISILFDLVGAGLVYAIGRSAGHRNRRATLAALFFLALPTVILNGAAWGQCDVIYTDFLLAMALLLIRGRPVAAMAMFGIALSLKVQAIFAAPFIAYLVLAGLMPLWAVAIPPVIYGLLVLPAALAGRDWSSLLTIYADQAGIANKLSARASNVWVAIQHFLPPGAYGTATLAGVAVSGAVSLVLIVFQLRWRFPRLPSPGVIPIVATMALWLALEPSLLPKMHDRYFFPADVFALALAVLVPRVWWIAALFQVGSGLAYSYFMMLDYPLPVDLHPAAMLGALATIPATLGIFVRWRGLAKSWRAAIASQPAEITDFPAVPTPRPGRSD